MATDRDEAEIIDVVRGLRQYTTGFDNCHVLLGKLHAFTEPEIKERIRELASKMSAVSRETSQLLQILEKSQQYRGILKKYRINTTEDDHGGE